MRSAANANSSSIEPETCVRADALCWMIAIPRAMRSWRDAAVFDCFLEADDDPIAIGKSMPCVVNESLFYNEHGRIPFLCRCANLEPAMLAITTIMVRGGGLGCFEVLRWAKPVSSQSFIPSFHPKLSSQTGAERTRSEARRRVSVQDVMRGSEAASLRVCESAMQRVCDAARQRGREAERQSCLVILFLRSC